MTLADELLDAAEVLRTHGTDGANRRAISTSYYAVFHAVCASTELIISTNAAAEAARRSIAHTQLARIAWQISPIDKTEGTKRADAHRRDLETCGILGDVRPELLELAEHIARLHGARESADYDTRTEPSQIDTDNSVDRAQRAVAVVTTLTEPAIDEGYERFLIAVVFQSRDRR